MVLEHLFPEDWLEKKIRYALILAVVYSTIGIVISRLLFAANSGIVSVVIVSLLLMPYLKKLLEEEEEEEERESSFLLKDFWLDNREAIKIYLVLFLGIFFTYMMYTFLLPLFGFEVGRVFREQLSPEFIRGGAFFEGGLFWEILMNNWWVLLACFLLALMAGDAGLFFVAWNASSWGAIFGFRAMAAGDLAYGAGLNLLLIVVITLPHVLLEGSAYILAAISGGILSDDIVSKRKAMEKFIYFFLGAVVVFLIAFWFFQLLFGTGVMAGLASIVTALGLLHLLSYVFDDKAHREVFQYNYYLFLAALALFIIGALVETFVLGHATALSNIYFYATV